MPCQVSFTQPLFAFVCCLLSAGTLCHAGVREQVDFDYYLVEHARGEGLKRAINAVTPYSQDGERMHGFTNWQIKWNFRYDFNEEGYCEITRSNVTFTATVGLPELSTDDADAERRFNRYMTALRAHEQNHVDIARDAAHQIDEAILDTPAEEDCGDLEREANAVAREIIADTKQEQRDYDLDTRHGRTEGAWLDR